MVKCKKVQQFSQSSQSNLTINDAPVTKDCQKITDYDVTIERVQSETYRVRAASEEDAERHVQTHLLPVQNGRLHAQILPVNFTIKDWAINTLLTRRTE